MLGLDLFGLITRFANGRESWVMRLEEIVVVVMVLAVVRKVVRVLVAIASTRLGAPPP